MKKALFFDIDGTLYDGKRNLILDSTIKALEKLSEEHLLFICSGRPEYMFDAIEPIKKYFKGFISFNGSVIRYNNEIIYKRLLNDFEINELKAYFSENQYEYGYYGLKNEGMSSSDEYYKEQFTNINFSVPPLINSLDEAIDPIQAFVFSENIADIKPLNNFKVVPWYEKGADLILKEESKLQAILFVKDYLSLDLDHIYVFGDGENDLEMLGGIKNSTCMGNGALATKEVSTFITDTIENDGLVKALKYWGLL